MKYISKEKFELAKKYINELRAKNGSDFKLKKESIEYLRHIDNDSLYVTYIYAELVGGVGDFVQEIIEICENDKICSVKVINPYKNFSKENEFYSKLRKINNK